MNYADVEKELNFNNMEGAPVQQSKYHPLNLEDFQRLKAELKGVTTFLPEHLMNPFWTWCNQIRGERTNQPCSCKSSAKLWGDCVTTLNNFVKEKDSE